MASRPVFLPFEHKPFAHTVELEFEWHPGLALAQQRKSIASLHEAARTRQFGPTLEISSKSPDPEGIALSAFNLHLKIGELPTASVEALFQSAKRFDRAGPFPEFLTMHGAMIKKDPRLRKSGRLLGFCLAKEEWPLIPTTCFYDWLYLNALRQNADKSQVLYRFESFSDIAFNPKRSINCQARTAAMYVGLCRANLIDKVLSDKEAFISEAYVDHLELE